MTVTLEQLNFPGMNEVVIDLGTGRPPRNTAHGDIYKAFRNIEGVPVDNVGTLRSHEGVWGVNRRSGPFTPAEVAKIKAVAETIASREQA